MFGILSIPAGLVILVGMMSRETYVPNVAYKRVSRLRHFRDPYYLLYLSHICMFLRQVSQKFSDAGKAMWMALKCQSVWRPCIYMYVSLALSFHIHEGMFYWYTDAKDGPSFSKVFELYLYNLLWITLKMTQDLTSCSLFKIGHSFLFELENYLNTRRKLS